MTDQIQVFTQSSIRISGGPGTLYLDPIGIPGAPHDADYILITHDHGDHFSPEDIDVFDALVKPPTRVVQKLFV